MTDPEQLSRVAAARIVNLRESIAKALGLVPPEVRYSCQQRMVNSTSHLAMSVAHPALFGQTQEGLRHE
jgi:flagellar biosynthesis component FlhA